MQFGEGLEGEWWQLLGPADLHVLNRREEVKELERGGMVGHVNENKQLVQLGETYIDKNRNEHVWRRGPNTLSPNSAHRCG